MARGRTEYRFPVGAKEQKALETVNIWLNANQFVQHEKKGETYFRQGSNFTRWCCLKYELQNSEIVIWAWLDSMGEVAIDSGISPVILDYRSMLQPLLQALNALAHQEKGAEVVSTQEPLSDMETDALLHKFEGAKETKNGGMAVAGFIIGIVALSLNILGFIGLPIMAGGLGCVLGIFFSSAGLKTQKKGLAIAGMVCSVLATLLLIIAIVLSFR